MSSRTFRKKIQTGPMARLATLLAVISALLVATPASGETVEVSAPPVATETPAPTVPTEPSAPAPQPAEIQEAASQVVSAVDSASTGSVGSVAESNPPPSSLENPPSPTPVDRVEASLPPVADLVSDTASKVEVPTGVELDTTGPLPSQHRVPRLIEDIGRASAQAIGSMGQETEETIAPVIDRLPVLPLRPLEESTGLLDSVTPATETLPVALLQAGREQQSWAPPFPAPALSRAGTFSVRGPIASELFIAGQLAEPSRLGDEEIRALTGPDVGRKSLSPATDTATSAFTGSNAGHHLGSPAAPDMPLPAPGSPATSSGAGGSSFAPIAALLALLALVPPATLRRLGRAADFRAPTPFVCALERPG